MGYEKELFIIHRLPPCREVRELVRTSRIYLMIIRVIKRVTYNEEIPERKHPKGRVLNRLRRNNPFRDQRVRERERRNTQKGGRPPDRPKLNEERRPLLRSHGGIVILYTFQLNTL